MTKDSPASIDPPSPSAPTKSTAKQWARRLAFALVALVALFLTYLAVAAIVPRWWAQRVGDLASESFIMGTVWGLIFGVVCTFAPLLLLLLGGVGFRKRFGKLGAVVAVLAALVTAIPNLMTLSIVLGTGNASHAGQRILDVDAPGFRGGTMTGALIGLLVFLGVAFFVVRYISRGRELRTAKLSASS